MRVIIIGNCRAEICKVKTTDLEKHFFQTRGQLYKVYPDGLTQLNIIDDAKPAEVEQDEVIIYAENETVPYNPRNCDYRLDTILMQIDQHKLMSRTTLLGKAEIFFRKAGNIWKQLAPMMGFLIVGVIVLWAFMQ